jgi:hypothetical protein
VHRKNPLRLGVEPQHLVAALRFILATPTYTGDTIIVDSGEHLVGRPRDVEYDPDSPTRKKPRGWGRSK